MLQDDCFWLTSWKPTLPVCDKLRCLEASLDASCSPWRPSTSCDRASPPPQPGWGLRHATRSSPCNKDNFAAQAHLKCDGTKYKGRLHHPTWARSPSWPSWTWIHFGVSERFPKGDGAITSDLCSVDRWHPTSNWKGLQTGDPFWGNASTLHWSVLKHVRRFDLQTDSWSILHYHIWRSLLENMLSTFLSTKGCWSCFPY